MKKKPLLFALLALAIVTSLTAGTLAVYTKTTTLDTAGITVKKFAFSTAGGLEGDSQSIKLAPTESLTYKFTVSNFVGEKGMPSEVDLNYDININFANAAEKMPGLVATITKKIGDTTTILTQNGTEGSYNLTETAAMNSAKTIEYVVTLTWGTSTSDQTAYAKLGDAERATGGLTVRVTATQAAGA